MQQHLQSIVEGSAIEFSDGALRELTDMARVRKFYKLNAQPQRLGKTTKERGSMSEEAQKKELEVNILGLMALRGLS